MAVAKTARLQQAALTNRERSIRECDSEIALGRTIMGTSLVALSVGLIATQGSSFNLPFIGVSALVLFYSVYLLLHGRYRSIKISKRYISEKK